MNRDVPTTRLTISRCSGGTLELDGLGLAVEFFTRDPSSAGGRSFDSHVLATARDRIDASDLSAGDVEPNNLETADRALLDRFSDAFERYDMDALTALIRDDATQSMPPYELWLRGRDDILGWWTGPGAGCRGSRVVPALPANGSPAFGQYKPSESGEGFDPWALQVLEIQDGKIVEFTFFLDTERVFPLFGLPPRLSA